MVVMCLVLLQGEMKIFHSALIFLLLASFSKEGCCNGQSSHTNHCSHSHTYTNLYSFAYL